MRWISLAQRPLRRKASRKLRVLSPLLLTSALALISPQSAAADQPPVLDARALGERVRVMVEEANLSPRIGLSIVDLATGQPVVAINDKLALNPASNLKLLTAAAALQQLGADFRMHTGLYGKVHNGRIAGDLCLKGQADPTLTRADLAGFAQRLRDEGVREVERLVIDASYFDSAILPPAFEQQPRESAPFRAAIGAVSINANAYSIRVRPGDKLGASALVSVDAAGYFEIDNRVITAREPMPTVQIVERDLGDRVALTLTGKVPLEAANLTWTRRVSSPLSFAGHLFSEVLTNAGVRAPKSVQAGTCAQDAPLIAMHDSVPLAQLLARLGKDSDNFAAEMVVKILGAERKQKPATTADGVVVVQETLRGLGLPTDGATLVNGSGLFQGNLVTTQLVSQLLATMYRNQALRPEFVSHLAVGGVDGTLTKRFADLAARRVVRAKTGTLADVIALSGYVLGAKPERAYAFSYLANGITGKQAQARELIDKVVSLLASQLFSAPAKTPVAASH